MTLWSNEFVLISLEHIILRKRFSKNVNYICLFVISWISATLSPWSTIYPINYTFLILCKDSWRNKPINSLQLLRRRKKDVYIPVITPRKGSHPPVCVGCALGAHRLINETHNIIIWIFRLQKCKQSSYYHEHLRVQFIKKNFLSTEALGTVSWNGECFWTPRNMLSQLEKEPRKTSTETIYIMFLLLFREHTKQRNKKIVIMKGACFDVSEKKYFNFLLQ